MPTLSPRSAAVLSKLAVELEVVKQKRPQSGDFVSRLVYGPEGMRAPDESDFANWQSIGDYMTASNPYQLSSAKVLSGPVRDAGGILIDQVERHRKHDSFLERLSGIRDQVRSQYGAMTPLETSLMPSSYHPYANTVVVNRRDPGVLIHELGHGVDMAPRPGESNIKRQLRWALKPTLWNEYSAWRKGRKAYQTGYAADPANQALDAEHKQYQENMRSYGDRKYPAYGSYLGGITGAIGGGIGGALLNEELAKNTGVRHMGIPMLGVALGGMGGALGGILSGKGLAKLMRPVNQWRYDRQLKKLLLDPAALQQYTDRLLKIREERQQREAAAAAKKKRKKSPAVSSQPTQKAAQYVPVSLLGGLLPVVAVSIPTPYRF
jgi:hypothetical protein